MSGLPPARYVEAATIVGRWRRVLLFSHAKPDGDALGSLIAMRRLLLAADIEANPVIFDPVPDRYTFLTEKQPLRRLGFDFELRALDNVDGAILLDTCALNQLEPIAEWLKSSPVEVLAVDHHVSRDDIADHRLIDETAAATCLILFDWARRSGWPIDAHTAEALFVGIATDTGWFRHSNTDRRVHEAAGELIARGGRPTEIYDRLYMHESEARFRLRAALSSGIELAAGKRLAILTLPRALLQSVGAKLSDTEDLVNEPLRIAGVDVSIMLVEQEGGVIRVGLRSRAPEASAIRDIDVAAIAAESGGGGHRRAAGARVLGTIESVRARLVERIEREL